MDSSVKLQPKLTVLMPVYNCELYIKEAIDSILNQTYTNFELLIIDDASTDKTVELIKKCLDVRINLIQKPVNKGLTDSLNHGLKIAKGKYIARMDGDDISLPERFAKQIFFLEENQEVILCGSWFSIIGSDRVVKVPEHHNEIKLAFLKGNCIAHPSVMMRKQALDAFQVVYDVSKEPAEDYDLWVRLLLKGKLHNLQEVLLDYRTHGEQVTKRQSVEQKNRVLEIKRTMFDFLELELLPEERLVFDKVINNGIDIGFNDIGIFKKLQTKLLLSNTRNFFDPIGFKKEMLDLEKIVVKRCFTTKRAYMPKTYIEYLKVKQQLCFKLTILEEFKLAIKSFIFFQSKK